MSRTTILNIALGIIAGVLLITLFVLETTDDEAIPPTITTAVVDGGGVMGDGSGVTSTERVDTSTSSSTTTTTTTTTTSTTTTLPPATFPAPTDEVFERFFVAVLVVNGTTTGQRLEPVVGRLTDIGYFDVRGVVGSTLAERTVIYYVDDFLDEAVVVAEDLGFLADDVELLPISDSPPVSGFGDSKVMVYLGQNVVPEPPLAPETTLPPDGPEANE